MPMRPLSLQSLLPSLSLSILKSIHFHQHTSQRDQDSSIGHVVQDVTTLDEEDSEVISTPLFSYTVCLV